MTKTAPPSPKIVQVIKIGPTSVVFETEETILLPRPTQPPEARVVALAPWRAHFMRGVYYGAVSTFMHMVAHWLGIW